MKLQAPLLGITFGATQAEARHKFALQIRTLLHSAVSIRAEIMMGDESLTSQ